MAPGADSSDHHAVEIKFARDGTLALVRTPTGIVAGPAAPAAAAAAAAVGGLYAGGSMLRGVSMAGSVLPASPGSTVGGWGGIGSDPLSPADVEACTTPTGAAPTGSMEVPASPALTHAGSRVTTTQSAAAGSSRALAVTLALLQQSEELVASLKVGGISSARVRISAMKGCPCFQAVAKVTNTCRDFVQPYPCRPLAMAACLLRCQVALVPDLPMCPGS
jgi:hypothetical protein